jgi:hypothetical protein
MLVTVETIGWQDREILNRIKKIGNGETRTMPIRSINIRLEGKSKLLQHSLVERQLTIKWWIKGTEKGQNAITI